MAQVFLFFSGKGGVGKSVLSAASAALLARGGKSVVLVDADLGLRSQDLYLGLENSVVFDLVDVAEGKCGLDQALLEVPGRPGLKLLPAAQFARVRDLEPRRLKKMLNALKKEQDYILIDCPAGIERGLRNVMNAGSEMEPILVVTPDDLCIRDAQQALTLAEKKGLPRPRLLVNRLQNDLIHAGEMYSAQTIANLLDLPLAGEVPEDPALVLCQLRHRLFIDFECEATRAMERVAARLRGESPAFPEYGKRKTRFLRRWRRSIPVLREVKRS